MASYSVNDAGVAKARGDSQPTADDENNFLANPGPTTRRGTLA